MESPIKIVKEYITQYSKLKFQELRLEALEKTVKISGYIIYLLLILLFLIGFICFGSIALAEWLTDVFDSRPLAYLSLSGIFLVLIIVLSLTRKSVVKFFANKSLWVITHSDEE
ncbi:MAG TPA: hypothetical protein PKX92_07300 [Edaphocola sp.]|nr:hypothetical protein [Edaphocola sp.]